MRNIFTFAFVSFLLGGCYTIDINLPPVPVTPAADAGPMLGGDGGPMFHDDAAPMPASDAGMVVAPGTTALVVTFGREQGILHPDASVWQLLGTLSLDSYGGDSIFRGVHVSGANIGLISELTLAQGGIVVGEISMPVGACSCGTLRTVHPLTVHDSEHVVYEIWGHIPAVSEYHGELTLVVESSEIDASAVGGGAFSVIVSAPDQSHFRVWNTQPVVTSQELSTHTLVNGLELDLYRIQISSAVAGRSLHVGSLTFRINGASHGTTAGSLSDLYLRLGSTSLSPTQYRMVRTATGEVIHPPMRDASGTIVVHGDVVDTSFPQQITVVFTDADGLLISGSGPVLTLVATPSGFSSGGSLETFFGDYIFSSSVFSWGNMTADGKLTTIAGDPGLVDPIVWTDDEGIGGVYTGAWEIRDLSRFGILTAP